MVLVGSSNLFIGSRLCDSVLMRCNVTQMTVDTLGKPVVSDLLDVEMQPRVPIGDNPVSCLLFLGFLG